MPKVTIWTTVSLIKDLLTTQDFEQFEKTSWNSSINNLIIENKDPTTNIYIKNWNNVSISDWLIIKPWTWRSISTFDYWYISIISEWIENPNVIIDLF